VLYITEEWNDLEDESRELQDELDDLEEQTQHSPCAVYLGQCLNSLRNRLDAWDWSFYAAIDRLSFISGIILCTMSGLRLPDFRVSAGIWHMIELLTVNRGLLLLSFRHHRRRRVGRSMSGATSKTFHGVNCTFDSA
jgi:hypothetical protein